MGTVPTLEQAQELLEEYNQDAFHLKHGKIVSGVMGYFAKEYDPENVELLLCTQNPKNLQTKYKKVGPLKRF